MRHGNETVHRGGLRFRWSKNNQGTERKRHAGAIDPLSRWRRRSRVFWVEADGPARNSRATPGRFGFSVRGSAWHDGLSRAHRPGVAAVSRRNPSLGLPANYPQASREDGRKAKNKSQKGRKKKKRRKITAVRALRCSVLDHVVGRHRVLATLEVGVREYVGWSLFRLVELAPGNDRTLKIKSARLDLSSYCGRTSGGTAKN
ncbi:uncharacterized protein CIMG_13626 [Coccidioides immitis RS]|uniref:Uncharacterized protein n=1 Tax=Coccidioides immitis (strain RS) TaxID=246410 RepID=A0A0D8JYR4_COCIM|nr:uncharacterized protein CIMG_13626 [Coccidioides immitis RS]KJF61403.1 hypothetical protein CIMG_13626 [Coccidioides immitis RS]